MPRKLQPLLMQRGRPKELAARVKEAFLAAQKSLQAEVKKANEAIRRGGRTEEFRYEPNPQPGSGNLLTANLTLNDGSGRCENT